MYLLYLDWNAMGGLRGTPSGEFAVLSSLLEQHRERFWIPYSSTHLDDLARGFDLTDAKKVEFTYNDLALIRQLTQGICFQTYLGQDNPEPDRRDPVEYFESHYEAQQEAKQTAFSLFTASGSDSSVMGTLLNGMLDLPVTPFPGQARATIVEGMFPGWSNKGTIRSVIEDMANTTQRANTDYTYSTEIRDVIRSGLPVLEPRVISSPGVKNPFERIEQLLAPHMGGRSIFEMFDSMLVNPTDRTKPPTAFQRFVNFYYSLELLGYHAEKLKPKNHFPNILGDATHAFLAGHCDFFVTNDKDLRYKAKAVYQKMSTLTHVLSVAEFVEVMAGGLAEYTPDTLPRYLSSAVRDGVRASDQADAELLGYVLPYDLFDLFNLFERRTDNSITFFRAEVTYRKFTLSKVIEQVIWFLDKSLGPNDNGKPELEHDLETQQMGNGTWEGRRWSKLDSTFTLLFDGRLELTIEFRDAALVPE